MKLARNRVSFQTLLSDNFRSIDTGHDPRHGIRNDPASSVSIYTVYQNLLKGRRLRNQKQNVHLHQIQMRENGSSLSFSFISLPNSMVNENWVCWYLQQFIFKKWCHVWCFDRFKLFCVNGTFTERFHLCVCLCVCAKTDFCFTVFVCSLYNYRLSATFKLLHHFGFVRSRLSVHIFRTTDTNHWHKIRNISRWLTQISKRQHNLILSSYY